MKHDGNSLHLDWCWDLEASSLNILHDFRVDFVFLLKLIECGNWVRKICSLNINLVLISEAVYLKGKRQTLLSFFDSVKLNIYGFSFWLFSPHSVTLLPREITRSEPQFSDEMPTETQLSVATLEFCGPTFSLLKRSSFSAVGFLSFASSNFASREDIHFIPLLSDSSGIDAASGSFKKTEISSNKIQPKIIR